MFSLTEDEPHTPRRYYDHLIAHAPEFQLLRDNEPSAAFLLRLKPKFRGGRMVLGTVYMPQVNGDLAPLFDWLIERTFGSAPTFLFVLDGDYWLAADNRAREILMFHEMCHCDQARDEYGTPKFRRDTGDPIWRLIGHDIEEFNSVASRYGAHSEDVRRFIEACRHGGAV